MKRMTTFLVLALMLSSFGIAEAKTKKSRKKPQVAPVTASLVSDSEAKEAPQTPRESKQAVDVQPPVVGRPTPIASGPPKELRLTRASSRRFDLRTLPRTPPVQQERNEPPEPPHTPAIIDTTGTPLESLSVPKVMKPAPTAPAPPTLNVFEGLDRFNWGAGSPPDTNGDVGPNHYIQTVNTSIGVYNKTNGSQIAAFTFNTFMSQGNFGNLCDTNNFGDPVVVYDTFEDRWIISDFAFLTNAGGNPVAPSYQCFAVSMNGDPVSGGWNFYSIQVNDIFNDYPKLGIWTDGLYMSANMFGFGGGSFQTARVWAFNKAQMYAGSPTVKVVSFDVGGGDFTVIPANARLQTGTPPPGRPNLFISTQLFLNAVTVYKFHVDWDHISLSTFTGPDTPLSATSWPTFAAAVPQPGTTQTLDSLSNRAMVQNQYTNFPSGESLWVSHTVRRGNTSGFAAPRWYQVNVTGGTVATPILQAATWDPDGGNVVHRWMPSLALDRAGNMAMGYSVSSSSVFPSIRYAGRLAGDPANTLGLSEQTFFTGTASQLSSNRWGDYSAMTLDPDGCTFWFTTEYATGLDTPPVPPATVSPGFNKRWQTKFGNITPFPGCVQVGAGGTVSGTVTAVAGGSPIPGATVMLGSRSATTDGSGNYSFSVPAGTYPSMTASKSGFNTASASSIVVTDGNTTTQNFALTIALPSACFTDTTQADFQGGVPNNTDLTASSGDVQLSHPLVLDQQNTTLANLGAGFNTTTWLAQTFTAGQSGPVVKVDINLFSLNCGSVTMPNLTVSIRAASGNLPTGADLATATIPGFCNGAGGFFTATFATPATITAGNTYAIVWRAASAIPGGSPAPGYFGTVSFSSSSAVSLQDPYAGGRRCSSSNSGATWAGATGTANNDHGFRIYLDQGFSPTGDFVSLKDANPAGGITPIWQTFSWNATTPANTSIKFQLAGSNSVNGPFNFVGPDGTAATFFTTSPVQLSPQFYNLRFLEYKAFLATTDGAVTPSLNDATICFNDVDCSTTQATITPTPAQVCASSAGNTAAGPPGMTAYAWGITNGIITSATNGQSITYTAGVSGQVTLTLTVTAPNGCIVSGSQPVTINPNPPKPTISGTLAFCAGGSTTLQSSAPGGNQWYLGGNLISGQTGQTLMVSAAGSYTVQVTDPNSCVSPMSDPAVVTQNNPPPTPTISADTNGTGTTDQACPEVPLTLHANGATGAVSYQWYQNNDLLNGQTNATYQATGAATYYVTATDANGCTTPQSAGYVVQNPTPHSPFISFRGQDSSVTTLHICQGSSQIIDSDSATGIQWYEDTGSGMVAIPTGGNSQSYTFNSSTPGTFMFTAQLNALGCHSQFGRTVTIIVDAMPTTPTITGDTNGTGTQDQACPEQPLTLHANGATGATSYTWYSDNAVIPNENTSTLVMTGVGNISVTATNGACTTPRSATYVVQNPTPHAPFLTIRNQASTTTSITVCQGTTVILDSDSATGIQWYEDNVAVGGVQHQSLTVTDLGTHVYTAQLNALGCHSQFGRNITVTINPLPPTPTINAGGPTTFCAGGSVLLTSSAATGNQWKLNGSPIGGQTNQTYSATASGSYTVTVTDGNGCSATSAPTTVTVNPLPATPTVNAGGPLTFCAGGSVTLTSSSASGNHWYVNSAPIGGATNQTYVATVSGDYTVVVTDGNGCSSAPSAVKTVVVNPNPNATITAPASVNTGSTGNVASVANAGAGATYNWSISGGTITAGTGTNSITFTAGAVGTLTLNVTVTTAAGCSDAKSANVTVTVVPLTITTVVPSAGKITGGKSVTINGTGFLSGATVTFGGAAATNVVVVNGGKITAKTPAHAAGLVNVTVTLPDTRSATLNNGYKYVGTQFDANGDNVVDPSDIFYLVNFLFLNGAPPAGAAGMDSGDANGDGVVDPMDIFYIVNYLFMGGPVPASEPSVVSQSMRTMSGSVTLGEPFQRDGHWIVPVNVATAPGSEAAQGLSLRVVFRGDAVREATIHRAGTSPQPAFEISRRSPGALSYLLAVDQSVGHLGGTVAEIEIDAAPGAAVSIEVDRALTLLSNQAGTRSATAAAGTLRVSGTSIEPQQPSRPGRKSE
jgi:hypothetical protein